MTDEREDAADDGDDATTTRGQTAVASRPARPTGKRSRQATKDGGDEKKAETEAGTTKKNGAGAKPKTTRKKGPEKRSANPISFIWNYLKQVVAELRKVIWPNRKQMISYTTVVLLFLVFMVALIGVVDLGLAKLALLVLA